MGQEHPASLKLGRAMVLLTFWLVASSAGFAALAIYGTSPGSKDHPPRLSEVAVPWVSRAPHQLLVALHPQCPCSKATVLELQRILASTNHAFECVVLQYQPAEAAKGFGKTSLTAAVDTLPGTRVIIDIDGKLSKQFRLLTSGAVVLYGPDGTPQFFGGITTSRGHIGKSTGGDSIIALLSGESPLTINAPVYGCPIHQPQPDCGTNSCHCDTEL